MKNDKGNKTQNSENQSHLEYLPDSVTSTYDQLIDCVWGNQLTFSYVPIIALQSKTKVVHLGRGRREGDSWIDYSGWKTDYYCT
jgi:hypothetical protein